MPHPPLSAGISPGAIAIRGGRLIASPDASAEEGGTVVVRDGRIVAIGVDVSVPSDARVFAAEGKVITAGFWNAHVHFTEEKWRSAARQSSAALGVHLESMLTSRGFTTVVDTGSDLRSTLPLRQRIDSGELAGPAILTSGTGLFPPRGLPFYVRESVPFWIRPFIPTPSTPAAAERIVTRNVARGTDLLKLFTGSYVARGRVKTMPEAIASAAAQAAHRHGQLVFSHASNLEGVRVALRAGVDVLAHPPDVTEGVEPEVLQSLIDRGMGMIPTLKMFATTVRPSPDYLEPIYGVVREFHRRGGRLLFGTDVGYMTDYETEGEFLALQRAGLDGPTILRMLTSAPAERFGRGTGRLEIGSPGDLVLLDGDPRQDIGAFARVAATVRGGRILYTRT
ncbi:MAG TPA: amidohydrolase family protein [Thermoplasmata archaeon]|nr:amidohydrolase family protein [Thermoplasmata archaeon]